ATPGRVLEAHNRVDQLHGLSTSYLVDILPDRKGLRVVFHAWFEPVANVGQSNMRSASSRSSHRQSSASGSSSSSHSETNEGKAQLRRLLALARGVAKLPDLVRRRRFGVQVPADLTAIFVSNPRCPCCTRSLAPVKLSLAVAASAIASRSLAPLKMDTRRCYLCGYLVCIDCWNAEHMESAAGRLAAIVVCTRCHACVQACDYSEVCNPDSERHCGPTRVVADPPEVSAVSLLVDFLDASLAQAPIGSSERAVVLSVIRTLLQQEQRGDTTEDDDDGGCSSQQQEDEDVTKLGHLLGDEQRLPTLEACKLGNAERRNYLLDLPDDPETSVPCGPMPSDEDARLSAARAAGLLLLVDRLAPEIPLTEQEAVDAPDVRDLELLCELAVKVLGCSDAFNPVAYPLLRGLITAPLLEEARSNAGELQETVGVLCCLAMTPRAEITHSQYIMMTRLASAASHFLQQKGRQLQQELAQVVEASLAA
ncbi:hypothetical protein BBJ28_00018101, partial [Nothophytophthora sp. Chile5]